MEIGNKILISYNNTSLVSFIEELLEEDKILIQKPYFYKDETLFNTENNYNATILTKEHIISSLIRIDKEILTNRRKYYLINILKQEKQKNQKRKYERLFCNLPYKIYLLDKHKQDEINVIIKDISLGGIRLLTNAEISKNITLKICLDNGEFLADGEIVQCQYYPKANFKNQYRIKFNNTYNEELLKNYFENIN